MKATFTLVECADGWCPETTIGGFTCYGSVRKTKESAVSDAKKFCERVKMDFVLEKESGEALGIGGDA